MTDEKAQSEAAPDYRADKFIALRAYFLWEKRGRPFGSPTVDWYQSIQEIREEMTRASGSPQLP